MKPFKSTIIIFDTEFITYLPKKLDLLEVGAVAIDNNGNIIDTFFIKCKPMRYVYNNRVKKHLKRIKYNTSEEYYSSGVLHTIGLYNFFKWSAKYKQPVFCSWSNFDHFLVDSKISLLANKDKIFCHDKINMFDLQRSYMNLFNLTEQPSLSNVLKEQNIVPTEETKFHNALHDSLYTSELFSIYFDHFVSEIRNQVDNSFRTIKLYK